MRGAEGIYTIWQEDGSTLYIDQSEFTKVDGPIHYSGVMTGTLYEDAVMGYVALPENSEIEEGDSSSIDYGPSVSQRRGGEPDSL